MSGLGAPFMRCGMIARHFPPSLIDPPRRPSMTVRSRQALPKLLTLLLALLLVALQTGGMLHALGHLSHDQRTDSPAVPQHAVCVLCVAYVGHDGALAPAPPAVVSLDTVAPAPVALRPHVFLPPVALPYQVRAPPAYAVV